MIYLVDMLEGLNLYRYHFIIIISVLLLIRISVISHLYSPNPDVIAVNNFAVSAMENIGLIIFKDKVLKFDNETDIFRKKQWVTADITHEISHQV